jgi:hypothetical protein
MSPVSALGSRAQRHSSRVGDHIPRVTTVISANPKFVVFRALSNPLLGAQS